jgi:hypothetical protein
MVSFCFDKIVQFDVVWLMYNQWGITGICKTNDLIPLSFLWNGSVINGIVLVLKSILVHFGKTNTTYRKPAKGIIFFHFNLFNQSKYRMFY